MIDLPFLDMRIRGQELEDLSPSREMLAEVSRSVIPTWCRVDLLTQCILILVKTLDRGVPKAEVEEGLRSLLSVPMSEKIFEIGQVCIELDPLHCAAMELSRDRCITTARANGGTLPGIIGAFFPALGALERHTCAPDCFGFS